jgi:hypothetical protein
VLSADSFNHAKYSEDSVAPAMNERTSRLRSFGTVASMLYDSTCTRRMVRDCADVTLDQVFAALVQHHNFCCLINFSRRLKHQRLFPLTHPQYHKDRISPHSCPSTLPPKRSRSGTRTIDRTNTSRLLALGQPPRCKFEKSPPTHARIRSPK